MKRLLCFSLGQVVSFSLGCVICVCVLIATEQRATAMYVDPGSGLLAIQSAASVVAAGAFFLRKKIRALFGFHPKAEAFVPVCEEKGDPRNAA